MDREDDSGSSSSSPDDISNAMQWQMLETATLVSVFQS
jgi:hypothetical protein